MSFPSGHSADASMVYLLVTMLALESFQGRASRGVVVTGAFLLVGLTGFSRTYLGVHWPTCVLAAWTLGAGWAYFLLCSPRHLETR